MAQQAVGPAVSNVAVVQRRPIGAYGPIEVIASDSGARFAAEVGSSGDGRRCRISTSSGVSVAPQSSHVTSFAAVALAGRSAFVEIAIVNRSFSSSAMSQCDAQLLTRYDFTNSLVHTDQNRTPLTPGGWNAGRSMRGAVPVTTTTRPGSCAAIVAR